MIQFLSVKNKWREGLYFFSIVLCSHKENNQGKCQVEAWFLTKWIGKKENEK